MIQVEGLEKTFGEFTAVAGISFEVRQGEIFAFLGPNGAGKTIKLLTTLLRPTRGTVKIDGIDPSARPQEVRKRFGIVFQDPSLDGDMTAYENWNCTVSSTMLRARFGRSASSNCCAYLSCGNAGRTRSNASPAA